jgi:hypothetical protein
MRRWRGWSTSSPAPFLVGDAVSLADVSLLAYARLAHEGASISMITPPCALDQRDRKIARAAAGR